MNHTNQRVRKRLNNILRVNWLKSSNLKAYHENDAGLPLTISNSENDSLTKSCDQKGVANDEIDLSQTPIAHKTAGEGQLFRFRYRNKHGGGQLSGEKKKK